MVYTMYNLLSSSQSNQHAQYGLNPVLVLIVWYSLLDPASSKHKKIHSIGTQIQTLVSGIIWIQHASNLINAHKGIF